jgi:hypothetical protein
VLSTVNERAATEVFERDCLIYLGSCVAPKGAGKPGETCLNYELDLPSGRREGALQVGGFELLPLATEETAQLILRPPRQWDVGAGPGQEVQVEARGGLVGLILDGRGRPIQIADDKGERQGQIASWHRALDLYGE